MEPLERTTLPTKASDKVIRLARRVAARRACERADRVIAVSGHVAHWLKSNWRIDDRRLAVIPHGVDSPGPALRPAAAAGLVGRRFIFSAGSIRPARGLTDLVMAMGRSDFPAELDLAFAGKPDPDAREFHADLLATVARLGLAGRVHWLGQCNSGEMDWGFANCELFVMTSRAEACPNTVLEALANGCLSVSCDTPPMPEFFGPAAIYYASGDPASLSAAVAKALALSPGAQNDRRELARQRASNFSWDSCARSTLDLLSEAVNARALDQGRSR
jgi:glycosyltransferase involved in cell wall biosynthesis